MPFSRLVTDWDSAYANAPNIPGGDDYPDRWAGAAAAFRAATTGRVDVPYGDHRRERYDLFAPEGTPRGLVVFVHGGYWVRFDHSFFSHLASGPLAHGWAVALPSYTLAPEARVGAIARQLAGAVHNAGAMVEGPIRIVGHSAGGQLATRVIATPDGSRVGALLPDPVLDRVERVVSVSGVHDLRPLLRIEQNDEIGLDWNEAAAESPALLAPIRGVDVTVWVGQSERAEFVRQSELLANVWTGLGARTRYVAEPDRHHFDVIEGLADPASPLTEAVVGSRS